MIKKLDDKNIEFTKILFEMKQNLDIYKLISLNAKEINEKGAGKTFWAIIQKATLRLFIIDVCKIYEKQKRNKLNSIPEILDFIKDNQIPFKDFEPIKIFIQNRRKSAEPKKCLESLGEIVDEFMESNKDPLNDCKTFRDKKLVHAEDIVEVKPKNLPNYDKLEELLKFGIDFYAMVHEAFIGGFPVQHKIDKRAFASLHSILIKLGHENIKIDFID